jgi:hypothetical protein
MKLKQSIENTLTTYNPNEFLPIYYDGELANQAEFIAYKATRFAKGVGHIAYRAAEVALTVLDDMVKEASK